MWCKTARSAAPRARAPPPARMGGRAARRRQGALSRQGVRGGGGRQRRDLRGAQRSRGRGQIQIDQIMIDLDGTPNKAGSGPTPSSACRSPVQAAADPSTCRSTLRGRHLGWTLPVPMMNIINGSMHADSDRFQEFMILPVGASTLPRRCAVARKSSTRCAAARRRQATTPMSATKAVCAEPASADTALDFVVSAIGKRATRRART